MNLVLRNKMELFLGICDSIEDSPIGHSSGLESGALKRVSLLQLAQYLMYLASSDGRVSYTEAHFIGELIPAFADWTPAQFKEWIIDQNVYSTEFEETPPLLLQLLVPVDNALYAADEESSDLPEMLMSIYRQIGQAFVECDGETNAEHNDYNTYLDMMAQFIIDNSERPGNTFYHNVEYGGQDISMTFKIGKPIISWSECDDE